MTDDATDKLLFLVLGWLFGLLGPVIVDAIKRQRENILGRKALLSELQEVGCILATAAYGVRISQGTADTRFLEWLRNDLKAHSASEQFRAFVPNLEKQLAWSDEDLSKARAYGTDPDGTGTVLQHYPVPLLDSRVSALWTFDTTFQRGLLAIRQELHILDDLVDRSRKYMDMTFVKLEGENYQRVQENFTQACALYAERAQRTVDRIRTLMKVTR
jgi:hypothetical protein